MALFCMASIWSAYVYGGFGSTGVVDSCRVTGNYIAGTVHPSHWHILSKRDGSACNIRMDGRKDNDLRCYRLHGSRRRRIVPPFDIVFVMCQR